MVGFEAALSCMRSLSLTPTGHHDTKHTTLHYKHNRIKTLPTKDNRNLKNKVRKGTQADMLS